MRDGEQAWLRLLRRAAGVDRDFVLSGDYELEVAGVRLPAAVTQSSLYDPGNPRVRA
jgi:sarcosine dehydrogenase